MCLSTRMGILHSTRDGRSYDDMAELLSQDYYLPVNGNVEAEALHIQRQLRLNHKPGATNPVDVLIAALAVEQDGTVLHYDYDAINARTGTLESTDASDPASEPASEPASGPGPASSTGGGPHSPVSGWGCSLASQGLQPYWRNS